MEYLAWNKLPAKLLFNQDLLKDQPEQWYIQKATMLKYVWYKEYVWYCYHLLVIRNMNLSKRFHIAKITLESIIEN